jgi:hypothetical protein
MAQFSLTNVQETDEAPSTSRWDKDIPDGSYTAVLVESERVPMNNGNGDRLKLKFEIVEGEFAERWIYDGLNLWHEKETVAARALTDLKRICRAVGVTEMSDSSDLHDKPLSITVQTTNDPQYGKQVKIKAYAPVGRAAPAPAQPAAVATPEPAPAAPGKKPWEQ